MELAKAYVQIIPSADGIKGKLTEALSGEAGSSGDAAGKLAGDSLVKKVIKIVGAAKIGQTIVKGISSAMSEGAELEQSIGGIETLFKESSDVVIQNAQNAFKTAGLSADEYMKSVTGFSASLLQGLGGDTQAAANIADMALTDMSDNANKMGTDMELIQNAYQGFAKQNYTMLDNLKLGYGGTKTEMERLLADAQAFSGVKYDINNLADVYSAIHVIQGEMEISGRTAEEVAAITENTGREVKEQLGTTAKEASETFAGSLAAVKASVSNLAGYMATGQDIGPAINNLIETASTFFFDNMLPMLGNILSEVPSILSTVIDKVKPYITENGMALVETLITGYQEKIPEMYAIAGELLVKIMDTITNNLPGILEKGKEIIANLVNGFLEKLPESINRVGEFVTQVVNFIGTNLPKFISAGSDILTNILNGIMEKLPDIAGTIETVFGNIVTAIAENLPGILRAGADVILNLINGIVQNFPEIAKTAGNMIINMLAAIAKELPGVLESGMEIIGELISGIIKAVPELLSSIPDILSDLGDAFLEKDFGQIGRDIINGLIGGIKDTATSVGNAIKEVATDALNAAKEALGIHSPSRKFKWIGEMCIEGFNGPLEDYNPYDTLKKSMKTNANALQSSFGATKVKENNGNQTNIDYERMGDAFARAFETNGFKLVVTKREMGRIVREVMV